MYRLLELREKYRVLYSKYSMYIDAVFKFLAALAGMIVINSNIGTMGILENPLVIIIISLVCALLPKPFTAVILMLTMVGHIYAIAMEPALVILVLFIVMYLLFFRFTPKESFVLIFVPILFMLKIPYVLPIILGLIATPASVISVTFGTLIYYLLSYIGANYEEIVELGSTEGFQVMANIVEGVLQNTSFYFCIIAFAVVLIFVYGIKRLSVDYSWIIAVCAGGVVEIVLFIVANVTVDMSLACTMVSAIVGGIISVIIAWFLQFFLHSVDYPKAERVQFEDDEYFYYVKAVPKITVKKQQPKRKAVRKETNTQV